MDVRRTLQAIIDEGNEQPMGRLLWRLKLCVEQLDAQQAAERMTGCADGSLPTAPDASGAELTAALTKST
jgi:hypothetical protein